MRDFKQSANKQLTIVLSCLLIAFLLIGVFAVSNAFNSKEKKISYAEVITVSDLDELLAVLEDSTANTTIIVTDRIDITLQDQDIELDGHGATITVPEPFVNPDGTLNENASDFGVFYFDVGNFSLKNMTIIGGGDAKYFAGMYAVRLKHGNLTMENVTITNSNGGLMVSDGNVALKNCNIVRNVREYGAGLYAGSSCAMVLDGCSLSENRSTDNGGGAMEVSGLLCANNTVISNNSSAEIGGAINCYNGQIFLTNCTVTGNITTGGMDCGGGLGYNSDNDSTIINSIIEDNYYYKTSTNEMIRSDIGVYNDVGSVSLVNCVYGDITGETSTVSSQDCKIDTNCETASGYREDGIMYTTRYEHEHKYTSDFKHPVLISKNIGKPELYVPAKLTGSKAVSGGVKTYLDYSNMDDIKIGYGEEGAINKVFGSESPDASKKVATYYEGGTRVDGVIGASGAMDATFYTVKLKPTTNGHVLGASIYGDSYIAGTEITLKGVSNSGYALEYWVINTAVKMKNPITISVDKDISLSANFDVGYEIEYNANGGRGTNGESYVKGTEVTIKDASDVGVFLKGYAFVGWNTKQDGTGDSYKNGDKYILNSNFVLYAQWKEVAIANTIDLINKIGTVEYTQECKAKIDAARAAYNELDADQKAKVTNYNILTQAEQTYAEKEAQAEAKPGRGINVGAVVGVIIAVVVLLLGLAYVLLFFVFNKFIVKDGKVVRAFVINKNKEYSSLITFKCIKEVRNNEGIFKTQKDAEDSLNK